MRFESINHGSLGDAVYTAISRSLIRGELRPGERLKIREIAAQMATSSTPVREAILRLVQDGALVLKSPRDIRVRSITLDEYIEIRAIRVELEGLAAAEAARHAVLADIRTLVTLTEDNERAMRAGDAGLATRINQQFHFELVTIARMPFMLSILQRIWLQMGPLISDSYETGGRAMLDHHYPVVEAIRHGDPDAARKAIANDIIYGGVVILETKTAEAQRRQM